MGEIHPAERYPAWALQVLFLSAILLVFIALAVAFGNRAYVTALVIHCLANALVLLSAWNGYRDEENSNAWVQMATQPLAIGLGVVDLILAGQVWAHFQPDRIVVLALVVPGAAGLLSFYLGNFRKKTAAETAAADERLLAREPLEEQGDDDEALTLTDKIGMYGSVALFFVAHVGLFLGSVALCMVWYDIVWRAIGDGASIGALDAVMIVWRAIQTNWHQIVRMALMLAGFITVSIVWTVLADKIKAFRNRRRTSDPGLDARVDAAVRAVWDFANRPDRPRKAVPVYMLPVALFVCWVASMGACAKWEWRLARHLLELRRGLPEVWYFYGSDGSLPLEMVGTGAFFVALWFFVVGRWPGAAEAAATVRYRRSTQHVDDHVEALRSSLTRLFKKSAGDPFDPRAYLLERRRRFVRWVYGISAVIVLAALVGIWASLNTYMLFTADGVLRHREIGSSQYISWREVTRVDIACTFGEKSKANLFWSIHTADGRLLLLADEYEIAQRLPALRHADSILRARGIDFGPYRPLTPRGDACLEKAGAGVDDFPGFLHLMHRD